MGKNPPVEAVLSPEDEAYYIDVIEPQEKKRQEQMWQIEQRALSIEKEIALGINGGWLVKRRARQRIRAIFTAGLNKQGWDSVEYAEVLGVLSDTKWGYKVQTRQLLHTTYSLGLEMYKLRQREGIVLV
jgi:hypothetical protein